MKNLTTIYDCDIKYNFKCLYTSNCFCVVRRSDEKLSVTSLDNKKIMKMCKQSGFFKYGKTDVIFVLFMFT